MMLRCDSNAALPLWWEWAAGETWFSPGKWVLLRDHEGAWTIMKGETPLFVQRERGSGLWSCLATGRVISARFVYDA